MEQYEYLGVLSKKQCCMLYKFCMLEGQTYFGLEKAKPQPDPLLDDLDGSFLKDREAPRLQGHVRSLTALDYQVMAFLDVLVMLLPMPQTQARWDFPFQPSPLPKTIVILGLCDFVRERQIVFLLFTAQFSHSWPC